MRVCVFCSSSDAIEQHYRDLAVEFGRALAEARHTLVYGGGSIGLMGVLARSVHAHNGRVIGVIPDRLQDLELGYAAADELIVTSSLRERKQRMEDLAEAFVALPGSIGTLEETLEVIASANLNYHRKPIVWLNHDGYFDAILDQLDHGIDERFAHPSLRDLYRVAVDPDDALRCIARMLAAPAPADRLLLPVARAMLEDLD